MTHELLNKGTPGPRNASCGMDAIEIWLVQNHSDTDFKISWEAGGSGSKLFTFTGHPIIQ